MSAIDDIRILTNMKTIAVTVDEATLRLLDELASAASGRRTRSALVRAALRQFAESERRRETEDREREIFRKHRKRLAQQARLLIRDQARP
ncbi:MAG TPA: ribbon-helix-helix protein, CopG family [Methylomirabilota bacterium]